MGMVVKDISTWPFWMEFYTVNRTVSYIEERRHWRGLVATSE